MLPNKIKNFKVDWRRIRWFKIFGGFFKAFFVIILLLAALIIIDDSYYLDSSIFGNKMISDSTTDDSNDCNVYGLELRGEVVTYIPPQDYETGEEKNRLIVDETSSEDITFAIEDAKTNRDIKAIILEVDSYGGSFVAGEEISRALKDAGKPTVVFIRNAGVSAAYLSASGAERIFASTGSDVGGIGVTMSYLDNDKQNKTNGLTYNQLTSGKFKDTGIPDKPLTSEEKKLLQRDIDIMHNNFVKIVATNRGLDVKKVATLADGSSMLGEMALANGLIDEIGGLPEVEAYLETKIGQRPKICW